MYLWTNWYQACYKIIGSPWTMLLGRLCLEAEEGMAAEPWYRAASPAHLVRAFFYF